MNTNIFIVLENIINMDAKLLEDIGLTKSETKVYFALLDLGSTTTGPLIKKSEISAGKIYVVLDKLTKKGLISYIIESGTKHFQAKDPELLLSYLQEKESELKQKENKLKKIIPQWKAKYDSTKYKPKAEIFEGDRAFKALLNSVLKETPKGDSLFVWGVPREANQRFEGFLMEWNKRREKKGVKLKIIYNHDCKNFGTKRKRFPLTKVRYMKQELETPAWMHIFGNNVAIFNVDGPIIFLMHNKQTADSYRNHFNILWKQAK
jgi:HTH-type transcriptional regulator, sugar sensing transcriptional regulator